MPRKRTNGEGTIYELPNGKGWRVQISFRINGKLHRPSRRCERKNQTSQVLKELWEDEARLRAQAIRGEKFKAEEKATKEQEAAGTDDDVTVVKRLPPNPPLMTYLHWWAKTVMKPTVKIKTFMAFMRLVDRHVSPRVGGIRIEDFGPMEALELMSAMDADGVKINPRIRVRSQLKTALQYAVSPLMLVKANAFNDVPTPRNDQKKKILPFSVPEMKLLMEEFRDTEWYAYVVLGFTCGLRQGELCGLKVGDIDWTNRKLKIERQAYYEARVKPGEKREVRLDTPKTKAAIRTVPLPHIAIAALREHQAIQMRRGLAGAATLFPTKQGGILYPGRFHTCRWLPKLKKLGLEHRGFHHARHTYATQSLSKRVPLAVVSKTLGHASQMITISIYSHWMPEDEFEAADLMDRLIG